MNDDPAENGAVGAFAELAREYCAVVEAHASAEPMAFLQRMHRLFARLYAAAIDLPASDVSDETEEDENAEDDDLVAFRDLDPDRSSAEELAKIGMIGSRLGDSWYYREVFDPHETKDPEVIGSLADDIVDTYGDLIAGLRKWDRGQTGPALWEWRFSFQTHWGEHVSGGLRALHARAAWHELPWPGDG